jgi:O-antigen ligase
MRQHVRAWRRWSQWATVGFLALMIVIPPLNPIHLSPLPSFFEEAFAFLFGLCAILLAALVCPERLRTLPRSALWLGAFVLLLASQILWRDLPYGEQALLPALYLLWAIALSWTALALREELGPERLVEALAWSVFGIALVSACLALIQVFGLNTPVNWLISRPSSARAYGNLNQPNLLADLLCLGLVCVMYLHSVGRFNQVAGALAVLPMLLALAQTGSRTAFVLLLWLVICAAWWKRTAPTDKSRAVLRAAVFCGLAYLACQLLLSLFFSAGGGQAQLAAVPALRAAELTFASADGAPIAPSVRLYIWAQALKMFTEAPLLGVGPGMFSWQFFSQVVEFDGLRVPGGERMAHNLVLHLLAEGGLVGAALVLPPVLLLFWRNRKPGEAAWRWWCAAMAGVIVLHALLENPLWYAHFLGLFALVLGLAETRPYVLKHERVLRLTVPVLALAGLLVLSGLHSAYRETLAWLYGVTASSGRAAPSLAALHRSVLAPYAELLASPSLIPDSNPSADDLAFSERLMRFMPVDAVVFRHVRLLAQLGRETEARDLLEHALAAYPGMKEELRVELAKGRTAAGAVRLLQELNGLRP